MDPIHVRSRNSNVSEFDFRNCERLCGIFDALDSVSLSLRTDQVRRRDFEERNSRTSRRRRSSFVRIRHIRLVFLITEKVCSSLSTFSIQQFLTSSGLPSPPYRSVLIRMVSPLESRFILSTCFPFAQS